MLAFFEGKNVTVHAFIHFQKRSTGTIVFFMPLCSQFCSFALQAFDHEDNDAEWTFAIGR